MNKNEMLVAAIKNGTVIDHIPTDKTYQVVNLLKLEEIATPVTIGYNYLSKKLGRKDYEVVDKKTATTPDELRGIVKCNNPKCITNNEPMQTLFHVVDKKNGILKCHYCEMEQDIDKVELV